MPKIDSPKPVEPKPGIYRWQAPGKNGRVYLGLDVVDRMLKDVMRGFGAVPKRGAEVGGILLGKGLGSGTVTIEIDDYELVPIEYRRGPSYLMSLADQTVFQETFMRLRHNAKSPGSYPVGFFRSHTRDAPGLALDDLTILDRYFPEPDRVALVIRPFATRVSQAGFYLREGGKFPEGLPALEFAFRRKDLAVETAPPISSPPDTEPARRPERDRPDREREIITPAPVPPAAAAAVAIVVPSEVKEEPAAGSAGQVVRQPESGSRALETGAGIPVPQFWQHGPLKPHPARNEFRERAKSGLKGGWIWLPLSFLFVMLGAWLGFQASGRFREASPPGDPFNAGLRASRVGENLNLRWDGRSLAVRAARHGLLMVEEGKLNRQVELTPEQLRTGIIVYPHKAGDDVRFTLELTFKDSDKLTEKLEWKE